MTAPASAHTWLGFTIQFLDESDWDTVGMMMHRWFNLNVRITLKSGEMLDCRILDDQGMPDEGDPIEDVSLTLGLIDSEDFELTPERRIVRYHDIAAIGVY